MGVRNRLLAFAPLLLALPLAAGEPLRPERNPPTAPRVIPRLLWIVGHNEVNIEAASPEGGSELRKTLEAEFPGRRVEEVHLANLAAAPKDAVLILAGPKRDFTEDEAAKLRSLLKDDARLFACIDPSIEHGKVELVRLRAVLLEAGADVRTERIIDHDAAFTEPLSQALPKAPPREAREVYSARFAPRDHAILGALPPGAPIVFENACRVAAMSSASDPFDVREIASTSPTAYAVGTGSAHGPAGPVLVAATRRAGPGRYVVAGDATFLTNGFAARTRLKEPALAIAAIRWLAEGLEAPPPERAPLASKPSVKDEDRQPIVLIVALAGAILLVLGAAVFARRP